MLKVEYSKWNQTIEELLKLSTEAEHARSRERYLALYMIGSKESNATQWAEKIGREDQTVMEWVHKYNRGGPEEVVYRHSGGRSPLLPKRRRRKSS